MKTPLSRSILARGILQRTLRRNHGSFSILSQAVRGQAIEGRPGHKLQALVGKVMGKMGKVSLADQGALP